MDKEDTSKRKVSFGLESSSGTASDVPPFLPSAFKPEIIEFPKEVTFSFTTEITSELITALINVGMLESLTTKNDNGTFTHELVPIDPEWANVIG
jgi:hypothetical protein